MGRRIVALPCGESQKAPRPRPARNQHSAATGNIATSTATGCEPAGRCTDNGHAATGTRQAFTIEPFQHVALKAKPTGRPGGVAGA